MDKNNNCQAVNTQKKGKVTVVSGESQMKNMYVQIIAYVIRARFGGQLLPTYPVPIINKIECSHLYSYFFNLFSISYFR